MAISFLSSPPGYPFFFFKRDLPYSSNQKSLLQESPSAPTSTAVLEDWVRPPQLSRKPRKQKAPRAEWLLVETSGEHSKGEVPAELLERTGGAEAWVGPDRQAEHRGSQAHPKPLSRKPRWLASLHRAKPPFLGGPWKLQRRCFTQCRKYIRLCAQCGAQLLKCHSPSLHGVETLVTHRGDEKHRTQRGKTAGSWRQGWVSASVVSLMPESTALSPTSRSLCHVGNRDSQTHRLLMAPRVLAAAKTYL